MTTTLTPPSAGPAPAPQPSPPSGAGRVLSILLIVFGSLVILGAVLSAVFATVSAVSLRTTTRTVAIEGVTGLDLDVAAGSLRVEFADVPEAELAVTSSWGWDRWSFDRSGDELIVSSPQGVFGAGWLFGGSGDAVLRLPIELEGADADMSLAAGELIADGEFGDLRLDLGAGKAQVSGSAEDVDAQISAGGGELRLADVSEATLSVSAGSLDATLTGTQPDAITAEVSAGALRLSVPDGEYEVTSDVSAGEFRSDVESSTDARSTIDVQVSAGEAVLRAG